MFTQDNKVLDTIYKVIDIIFVSILWLITCLPVITIGAATASMYNTVIKVHRQSRGYVFRNYFSSFKDNFLTTLPFMPVILLLAVGLFGIGYLLVPNREQLIYGSYLMLTFFMFLELVLFSIHLFLLAGRFQLTRKQLLGMALRLSFSHAPQNLLILFVCFGLGWITLEYWPLSMVFPGLFTFFMTYLEEMTFHKVINYEDDLKETVPDDDLPAWDDRFDDQ